jgi:phage tail protein X
MTRSKVFALLVLAVALGRDAHDARADDGLPSPATSPAPPTHTVKKGDTCAAIAQRYYGDSRLVDVLHRANAALASTPSPHNLREGMILVIPPLPAGATGAPASAPDAQLTTVKNHVEVQNPETKEGKPNDPLFRGNRVSTEASSAADVTFRDETQVKLGERTLVIILGDARSAAAPLRTRDAAQATLVTGNLRAWMSGTPLDAAAIATEAAMVRIASGEAAVSVDAVKTTRLAVYADRSTITARGKTREVTRGFGSKADLGKEPTVPRPLPLAPAWTSLPATVLLDRGTGAPPIEGDYDLPTPDPRILEWRVQIARDEAYREVIVDTKVPVATHRFEGQTPGPGRYFVRVSAIDDDQFEGPFGPSARVLVVRVRTTRSSTGRRLTIEPADAYCVRVGNVALSRVTSVLDVGGLEPVALRCAPAEALPTTLLRFD